MPAPSATVDRPALGWWVAILGGLGLNAVVAFVPAAYDAWCRHVTAALPAGLLQLVFVGGLVTHVGEALYARALARRAGIPAAGWFWQTLAIGFPSLSLLRRRTGAG